METVTLSSRYQGVIPESVRWEYHIRPGDQMAVIVNHEVVHLVRMHPLKESKGFLKGLILDSSDLRDHHDRF